MAYGAVDKDKSEHIFEIEPLREGWFFHEAQYEKMPKGSIEKLIGRKLTWEDEPVELKEHLKPEEKLQRLSVKGLKPTKFEADACEFSLRGKLREDMADSMISQKEDVLKEAVEYALGREYQHEDIITQGERLFLLGGTEQFKINGELLLEFYPVAFTHEDQTITAKVNYRKFYEPIELKE